LKLGVYRQMFGGVQTCTRRTFPLKNIKNTHTY